MKKVITFGEVMMRLSTQGHSRFAQTNHFEITFGGGDANVASSLAQLGIPSSHVTKFPAHQLGDMAINFFKKNNVDTQFITRGGERIGQYFVENGSGMRSTQVVYDRFHSSFSTLDPQEYNWEKIFENAQWFHFTGITPAISESAAEACLEAVKMAKKMGIYISADVNYRKNLWQYGKSVKEIMPEIVAHCDLIVCGIADAEDILGIVPKNSENEFESICKQIQTQFPNIKLILNTQRIQKSASHNALLAYCWTGQEMITSPTLEITDIIDRIGGGDAFVAGFIYGKIIYKDDTKALSFAVAASALKHTIEGDVNLSTVAEVEQVMAGDISGRIKR